MQIFISYASDDARIGKRIAVSLRNEDHKVYLDQDRLVPGSAPDGSLREEIAASDYFVFLISAASLADGRYTLTEVKLAEQRWPAPKEHVLPVLLAEVDKESIPPYLLGATFLTAAGDVAAEVAAHVATASLSPVHIDAPTVGALLVPIQARTRWSAIFVSLFALASAFFGALWGRESTPVLATGATLAFGCVVLLWRFWNCLNACDVALVFHRAGNRRSFEKTLTASGCLRRLVE